MCSDFTRTYREHLPRCFLGEGDDFRLAGGVSDCRLERDLVLTHLRSHFTHPVVYFVFNNTELKISHVAGKNP